MKLRRCFSSRQLLFAASLCALLVTDFCARAQDSIVTRDNKTQQAKILGANGSSVQVQVGAGTVGIPIASIAQVNMPAPPDFATAVTAFEAKDYAKALASAKAVADKYKGLPTDWAQQAASMIGDIYVALNDLGKAEAAYKDFQKLYPGAGSVQAEIGIARIAASKKDFATAKQKLAPILAQALKEKNVPKALGPAYSQAFYVSGQVKEAAGDYPGALEDYLRTVTIFYHDRVAVSGAQDRANAIRKEQGVTVP